MMSSILSTQYISVTDGQTLHMRRVHMRRAVKTKYLVYASSKQ